MGSLTATTAPVAQLFELIAQLNATAGLTACDNCRSGFARECAAGASCCDDCRHTMPAAAVVRIAGDMGAVLTIAMREAA